jgi:hypothetical protein
MVGKFVVHGKMLENVRCVKKKMSFKKTCHKMALPMIYPKERFLLKLRFMDIKFFLCL